MQAVGVLLITFACASIHGIPFSATISKSVSVGEPNSFLKPVKTGGKTAALIFIQGAQVPASRYKPLMQAIQTASDLELWVGLPSFLLDTPEPARLNAGITDTLKMMTDAGMDAAVPTIFGAHSLGTVFLQQWCASNEKRCKAQLLTGGFIARTSYYPSFSYKVPTLTLGGTLDGLARVTRTVAESFYNTPDKVNFPVAMIVGMNHYQWGSGAPSLLESQRDLRAEVSLEQAHAAAAELMADFMDQQLGAGGGAKVAAAVKRTAAFVKPIIDAYEYEGSRHFNAPRQIGGAGASACVKGGCPDKSAWAPVAQAVIAGGLEGWTFSASNEFVDCSSTPITGAEFHLPNISSDAAKKHVSTTTYSQCNWDLGDAQDTGFVYTSASEIGTKLSSLQCLLIKGVGKNNTPFSVDDPQFCAMANQKAYDWALANAGDETLRRYKAHGQPYTFGPDIGKSGGPLFLDAGITYKDNGDAGVEISSPMQKTDIDYWQEHFHVPRPSFIPDPGCFHYCKLLSPARAMEWIYVDGLRRHLPINATSA